MNCNAPTLSNDQHKPGDKIDQLASKCTYNGDNTVRNTQNQDYRCNDRVVFGIICALQLVVVFFFDGFSWLFWCVVWV